AGEARGNALQILLLGDDADIGEPHLSAGNPHLRPVLIDGDVGRIRGPGGRVGLRGRVDGDGSGGNRNEWNRARERGDAADTDLRLQARIERAGVAARRSDWW